ALTSSLVTIVASYRQSSSLRERQQQRLFMGGVILAFAPLLVLTVLPSLLNLPQYVINGQLSTITLSFFPLALGYTILRYQVLVFDMYIRRAVAWMVGGVGLAMLGYLVFTVSSIFLSRSAAVSVVAGVVLTGVLAPCIW